MSFALQRLRTECTLTIHDQGDDLPRRLPIHDLAPDDGPQMIVDAILVRYLYGDGNGWRLVGVSAHGVRAKVNGTRGLTRVNRRWRLSQGTLQFAGLPDWVRALADQYTPVGAPAVPLAVPTPTG